MKPVFLCKNIAKGQLFCQDLIDSNGENCECLKRVGGNIKISYNFKGIHRVTKIKKILDKIG